MTLKELRKTKKLTQKKLASMLSVNNSTICQYEKNSRKLNIDKIIELASALNVTEQQIIDCFK